MKRFHLSSVPKALILILVFGLAILATGFAQGASVAKPGYVEENVDLEALIKAAKAEGELVVYWTSSRITVAAKNFEAKYGIKVKGTKMADPEQAERVIREVDSGKVQVDAIGFEDGPLPRRETPPRRLRDELVPEGSLLLHRQG